jgi:hypothetical protein
VAGETGVISVGVPREMATAGAGFSFPLPEQLASATTDNTRVIVTTLRGDPLPSWLQFDVRTKTFTASAVPEGSFPMQVRVQMNSQIWTVVISERQ